MLPAGIRRMRQPASVNRFCRSRSLRKSRRNRPWCCQPSTSTTRFVAGKAISARNRRPLMRGCSRLADGHRRDTSAQSRSWGVGPRGARERRGCSGVSRQIRLRTCGGRSFRQIAKASAPPPRRRSCDHAGHAARAQRSLHAGSAEGGNLRNRRCHEPSVGSGCVRSHRACFAR